MMENVQCPVCTLFLHAGMDLSDHLETHPKEHVIKALVLMTISGVGGGIANASLAAALVGGENKTETDSKPILKKEPHLNCNSSASNSSSSLTDSPAATCSSNSSLNFAKTFSSPTAAANATAKSVTSPGAKSQKQLHLEATINSVSSGGNDIVGNSSSGSCGSLSNSGGGGGKAILNQHQLTVNLSPSYRRNIPTTTVNVNETSPVMPTDFSVFAADHYQQQRQQLQHQHQQQTNSVSQLQQRHSTTLSAPPPPPLPGKSNQIPITVHELQQQQTQQQHTMITPATTATHRHQHVHTHKHQPQQQQQHQQQHNQAQQNFKIVYSSTLPPTPQLQLFSYHSTPQLQHQKPPPAYGTAISQIRSQNNQNKKNATIATQQHPHHHQPHMHARAQSHLLPPPLSHPPPSVADAASTSKNLFQTKQTEFSPPPPPPPPPTQSTVGQQLKFTNEKPIQNYYQHFVSNINNNSNNSNNVTNPKFSSTSVRAASSSAVAEAAPPVSPPQSPQIHSLVGSSSSSNRQTNSPFTNMASQSPSSVLRYAESPVAHYLERDNGDFIVQEQPKHIFECVEKDNGEFSVIERIYQSPLSVLHIHDDDEDGGNDDNEIKEEELEVKPDADSNDAEVDAKNMSTDQNVYPSADDEEFMSITSEREHGKEEEKKGTKTQACGKENANEHVISNGNLNMEPSTSSAATATGTLNSTSIVSSPVATKKKSTKNSVTVISDVHLNLTEYLDLVGTILASNTMVKDSMPRSKPIPLVKVEKIEPLDEDEMAQQPQQQQNTDIAMHVESAVSTKTTIMEPPANIANKNETEDLCANSCSKNKTSFLNEKKEKPSITAIQVKCRGEHTAIGQNIAVTCSSHVTSVIRMATTSQHQMPQQQQEPQKFEYNDNDEDAGTLGLEVESSSTITAVVAAAAHKKNNFDKEENIAEDLSQPQLKTEEEPMQIDADDKEPPLTRTNNPPPPLALKRGPKKLVIKPKITTKTDTNANNKPGDKPAEADISIDKPTTFMIAQDNMYVMEKQEEQEEENKQQTLDTLPQNIVIKSEPNTNAYDGSNNSSIILEQHLKLGSQQIESKNEEKPFMVENFCAFTEEERQKVERDFQTKILRKMNSNRKANATNENVVNDAHVLLDFAANSINRCPVTTTAINFLSSSSIFTTPLTTANAVNVTAANSNSLSTSLRCDDEYVPAEIVQEIVISSSYSSQSASDVALNVTSQSTPAGTDSNDQQHQHKHYQQQQQHTFTDYPFSFLYGGGGGGGSAAATGSVTKGNFSPIYQQAHDATTAATLASGSTTSVIIEDSTSAQASSSHHRHQHNRFDAVQNTVTQWYHHTGSTANSDFEAALTVDCSAAVDGDVGKYLDLDTCKREHIVGIQAAPSSTSSSFTAATESSLAGGCTADALNIRTDEKMPAKGEISEQESNCDIENSWSQPMYSDLSARFFKSSFPGIFQQVNGWNQDEIFTIQDLSAPTTAAANASNRSTNKSFDFRLPLEATTSAPTIGNNNNNSNNHIQLFGQHNDVLPSLSTSISTNKKKRKRDAHSNKATITRMQPTATITSQQMLQQQLHPTHLYANHQLQQHQLQSTTTAALLAGPSTAAASAGVNGAVTVALQQKQRKKIYQCPNCAAEFPKLKERNSHMIVEHNYVRQNRRLICYDTAANRGLNIASANTTATITSADLAAAGMASSSANILLHTQNNIDCMEDSKQGIVKIEIDNTQQQALPTAISCENINAKAELVDEKENISLVPATSSVGAAAEAANGANMDIDRKPNLQPIAVTTPATKLAALYRMLVSFNISTLKQNQILTELEQKEIETSIFFCYVCRKNFTSVKLYDAHLTEHPAECFTCGKKFHRWKNFSLHLKRHLGWKEFGCNVCAKKFVVRSALVEHTRMHTGQTPLKCKICGKNFKRYSNLTQHRKRHGKQIIRKKEYVCHCGEVLPSKARFLWHKETHDAKPKCCPHCCDRFVHANSLRRHIRLAHSDKFDYTEPMECTMCNQTFAKSSLKAHMATHSTDTQHDCNICNKSFSTKWNLKIHKWVHANRTTKPFKCEHCPKAFVREVDFKNHMNAHKQIKPYTCEHCGCKFIRKYNYMRHRREHHGNKKFTCEQCKKSFHRHYYLIEHRRIHTGERPFQCTICGKSSTTKTNHNKHLKIHHSRDPFTVEA